MFANHRFQLMALLLLVHPAVSAYVGLCCGKCGGNMPMNIPGGGVPETYEFRLKVSPMYMRMDGLRDGTDSISAERLLGMPVMGGMPTGKFMAAPTDMDMRMLNITAGYSFSDNFFAGVMLMYRDNSMDMLFNTMMQTITGRDGYAMQSGGMADTMFMAKYRLYADDPLIPRRQVSMLFGLNLPTGSINRKNREHPLAMRQTEQLPYGMQLGSGTFDPTIGLLYQGVSSPYWWGVNSSYTARLYDNRRDYRLGDEVHLDTYGMYQLRHDLLAQVQLNAKYQSDIQGEMDEAVTGESGRTTRGDPDSPYMSPLWDPDNYGGKQLLMTLGFQWQPVPLHIVDFTFGVPVYQDLNGPRLEKDYRVMLTWYIEIPTPKSIRYGFGKGKSKSSSRLGF